MISEYIYHEIVNWARWCTEKPHLNHCKSLEHRYRPESDLGKELRATIQLRTLDAAKIETVISTPSFPTKQRSIIINNYVHRFPHQKTCRILGISFKHYDYELERAVTILENRLNSY